MTTSDEAKDAATAAAAAQRAAAEAKAAAAVAQQKADELAATAAAATAAVAAPAVRSDPISEIAAAVTAGYTFEGAAVEIGALVDGEAVPTAQVRIPLAMLNRHGLVAGATGTGKTKTLQVLAEQVAAHGVPVFAADIKGDLSGIATPGAPSDKLAARCESIGQPWTPLASITEYFTLGGLGTGVPIRASVASFGPTLLAKVLGLNATQESSLGLVFHYARKADLELVDLTDLRSVLNHLNSAEGKSELKELGGLSAATVGVILRELITFGDDGADVFFGRPEIDVADFLRVAADGRGIVSLLEVPGVQDKPALYSTFLMYLLQQLFETLPEVGDSDKPKLVFFFDEAHLLFKDASKDFLSTITQTVRLIRSKGVGIFFVTQTPKDVPSDVLAQLGFRVQHQLRSHTPDDAKALKATVSTYPTSSYKLGEVLQQLAIGEAIVTVMNDKGAPTPVAWTRVRAPQGSMDPTPAAAMEATVAASPLQAKYGTAIDPESAAEALARATAATAEQTQQEWDAEEAQRVAREADKLAKGRKPKAASTRRRSSRRTSTLDQAVGEASRTLAREIVKNLFKRRR
ncbi:helicase HerA-like domain-containing protein [Aeromicrobium sp. CF3.5]|uniref:helicase HerA-like domain-containing protein n=1 Tax=Aeromicrobium sp. CF3.5 TaxID=3373078 RepID=UPI003EE70F37